MRYDDKEIRDRIYDYIERNPRDVGGYEDYFSAIRNVGQLLVPELKKKIRLQLLDDGVIKESKRKLYELYRKVLCYEGRSSLDSFMLYNEIDRPIGEQFWYPRRSRLLHVCRALEDLENGKLDELFLSQPPRTGKSTLIEMDLLWIMGRNSERSNLYCSYTDSVVKVLYKGLLEVLQDPTTYRYSDIFPDASIASTDAADLLLNLERKKRYASFTGRSLYGTLNGACDCNGYLIGDDLISGIEEAQSKDRLESAWSKVDNNLLPRAKEDAKILWIGTRWSLADPQGKRIDLLENDPRYANRRWKIINTPALDPHTDESNFRYGYGVGFSTEFYQQRRASFERSSDMASWLAQYQGEPIEREGAVFSPDEMRYYNGTLPEVMPDRVFMVIDPSWGGGDYTAAPVVYQYGQELYVPEVVFSSADKTITQALIVGAVERHKVTAMKIEGTKTTSGYGEELDSKLKNKGIAVNMTINTSHYTGNGKRDRIFGRAPDIRSHMIFLSEGQRAKEYTQFMQNIFSFTFTGKSAKHDDAPDVCAMVMDYVYFGGVAKAEVITRTW